MGSAIERTSWERKRMDRRCFVKAAACVPLAIGVRGARASSRGQVSDGAAEEKHGTLRSRGDLDRRFDLTFHRVLRGDAPRYSEEFLLADVRPTAERRFTAFSGDLSGRYIGALAVAGRVYGVETPGLDALVEKTIALQKPDGYFGSEFHFDAPNDADMALLWGNGRLLVGLLEYHQWNPSARVLESSRRIGDFLLRISPLMQSKEIRDAFNAQHFAASYICWTQQTEGLAKLYGATKDERYRTLAANIAAVTERRAGDHVHGYLTSLRGAMELYGLTQDDRLLRQCKEAWQEITASRDLLVTGGVPEGWTPNNHRTEGCGEADWVRLNLALWRATGDMKYLAMSERAIFNELAFNQFATGDFGHRVYTDTGLPGSGAVRAWWCCTLHGLRCFPDIRENAFRATERGLSYDLPVDGQIEAARVSARAESTLAEDGSARIAIARAADEPVAIEIRRPEWADAVDCRVETRAGTEAQAEPTGLASSGYQRLYRRWKAGDVLVIRYQMKQRSQPSGEDRRSFWYGPWLLGASAAESPDYFNELTKENQLLGDSIRLPGGRDRRGGSFSVPAAETAFRYAPAEYPDQPGTVLLLPVAEQTGQGSTSWEVSFRRASA
jgi:DUF1680 family protein